MWTNPIRTNQKTVGLPSSPRKLPWLRTVTESTVHTRAATEAAMMHMHVLAEQRLDAMDPYTNANSEMTTMMPS